MDQAAIEPMDQDVLGRRYRVELARITGGDDLAGREDIPMFLARLPVSTTLTDLEIDFYRHRPFHQDYLRIVQSICECLANLQREHHPLRSLELSYIGGRDDGQLLAHAIQLILIAAKQFGIAYLKLGRMDSLPMEFLFEFCHDNRHLIVLELENVSFTSDYGEEVSTVRFANTPLAVEEFILNQVIFDNLTMTSNFANLVHAMGVSALSLGTLICWNENDEGGVLHVAMRIVSELVKPSVQQLKLLDSCKMHYFQAALSAGTAAFLIELNVSIECYVAEATSKVYVLRRFIGEAVQLQSLAIFPNHLTVFLLRSLVETLEACSTITRIEVGNYDAEGVPQVQPIAARDADIVLQFRQIAARNDKLAQFMASPNTYSKDQLLDLLQQFDHCPTGRYRLARTLPEVFNFQRGDSLFH
jgi:hypothetical protein